MLDLDREQDPRAAVERSYLLYSPLWMVVVVAVLVSGEFAEWRDLGHMLLGVGMALPIWLAPLFLEPERPLVERYSLKTAVYITLLSFLQNYFGTPLFFRYFGLEYHFPVTLLLNGTPLSLSFMTVAYFATYFAIIQVGLRFVEGLLESLPVPLLRRGLRLLAVALLSYAMALLETLFMANKYLSGYFAYGDKAHMMFVGSLCYGSLLFIAILVFVAIDADPERPTPLSDVVWRALGANTLVLCAYEVYAHLLSK